MMIFAFVNLPLLFAISTFPVKCASKSAGNSAFQRFIDVCARNSTLLQRWWIMTVSEIIERLEAMGGVSYRRILMNHGAKEPVLGVKIADLKLIQKEIRVDYPVALELFDTRIYDAQYLAALITDDARMTKRDLRRWLTRSNCPAINSTSVAWVTAGSRYAVEMALEWIPSEKEDKSQTGWMTMASLVSFQDDSDLDLDGLKGLLEQVGKTIQDQPNLVRYAMNGFVIATGCFVSELTKDALRTAKAMGKITVDMGNTACQVPSAVESIQKVQKRGTIGNKRRSAKC